MPLITSNTAISHVGVTKTNAERNPPNRNEPATWVVARKMPDVPRTFKVPAYLLVGGAAILGCGFIFYSLPVQSQIFTFAWMVIGLIVYFSYGRWNSRLRKGI